MRPDVKIFRQETSEVVPDNQAVPTVLSSGSVDPGYAGDTAAVRGVAGPRSGAGNRAIAPELQIPGSETCHFRAIAPVQQAG
jgi:hypothetical protein